MATMPRRPGQIIIESETEFDPQSVGAENKSLIEELRDIESSATTIADIEKAMMECEQRLLHIRQLSRDTKNYEGFTLSLLNDARRAIMVVEKSTLQYEISANKIAVKKDEIEKAEVTDPDFDVAE